MVKTAESYVKFDLVKPIKGKEGDLYVYMYKTGVICVRQTSHWYKARNELVNAKNEICMIFLISREKKNCVETCGVVKGTCVVQRFQVKKVHGWFKKVSKKKEKVTGQD
ncbi:hypothetical protein HanPI659440_Chr13g0504821 [Helianthus annuus]|nr:hypothetical protein HanPI659440_Chr13g0504821 [Helianthus annuus]